jgi:hypothetical protein
MSSAPDRITELLAQSRVTGIDFIYVYPNQVTLDVYFLRSVTTLDAPMPGTLTAADIQIYSSAGELPVIEVIAPLNWVVIDGQDVLRLQTKEPGDFSLYKFKIDDIRLDPFYNDISFSFKANCPTDLDCNPPEHECPADELVDFPIDYLARDFWSYRKALLDFAALRYPDWADRLEADAGVMMVELMSALGDEMAYYQDRVSREAYLETATQRRSIRRHARLVDYHMHDGLGATSWLDVTVKAGNHVIPSGTDVFVLSDNDSRVDFEFGHGISEIALGKTYSVDAIRNEFLPHLWDEDQTCLPVGTTELYLEGHHAANLPFDDFTTDKNTGKLSSGKWVLLKINPTNPAQPARVQLVRLIKITDTTDPVLNLPITHIIWEQEQALAFEFDMTILSVRGNMVPATAGQTNTGYFVIDKDLSAFTTPQLNAFQPFSIGPTVEREGHDDSLTHLFTLPGSQNESLVYLGKNIGNAQPEITLQEVVFNGVNWVPNGIFWTHKRSLLGVNSSKSEDNHFTLDDGTWQRLVGYQRIGEEFEHRDYAFNKGVTIRFGDGEFGRIPDANTVFIVNYRLGGGRRSNVAPESLKYISPALPFIESVTNPLSATGGVDAETPAELRQLASEAFRAITYRAVRPEDYAEAAERLPWVQKAGASFRWTGSWLTAFVTPDPKGKVVLEEKERRDLMNQMNRFRQAGREVYVMDPEYANIDLEIHICVGPDAYAAEVKERVLEALLGKKGIRSKEGYFSPDRFTFGTLLDRSTLEAAIQKVTGVRAVEQIRFRRRGWFNWRQFSELSYNPGKNVIIRIANDSLHPERGTLKLYTHGGL